MSNTMVINNLKPIMHNDELILTTKQLAEAYDTDEKNIQMNFSNNKNRFIKEKHYYFLQGKELKEFKESLPNDIGEPLKYAPSLYLWTERGASRHCKILDTDRAWDRFDTLEEVYFRAKEYKKKIIENSVPLESYTHFGKEVVTMNQLKNAYGVREGTIRYVVKTRLTKGEHYELLKGDILKAFSVENNISIKHGCLLIIPIENISKIDIYLKSCGIEDTEQMKIEQIEIPKDALNKEYLADMVDDPFLREKDIDKYLKLSEKDRAKEYFYELSSRRNEISRRRKIAQDASDVTLDILTEVINGKGDRNTDGSIAKTYIDKCLDLIYD